MHIGLIGGIGPAATEYYYRGLVRAHDTAVKPLEVTIVHADVRVLMRNLLADAADKQALIFRDFIARLQAAGAKEAAITALAGHFCLPQLIEISPLPIVSALDVLKTYLQKAGIGRVGILGTLPVMRSGLFGGLSNVEVVTPRGDALGAVQDIYAAIARTGQATDAQRSYLFEAGKNLCDLESAEAVLLAGTDLFLAFGGHDCGYPVIDCAEVHIDALAERAMT